MFFKLILNNGSRRKFMEDFDFQLKNSKQIKSETVAIIHQNKNIFQ